MSEEIEKALLEKLTELSEDMKEVKEFIGERDVVSNEEYRKIKKISKTKMYRILQKPGCPRVDSRNVSKKALDKFIRDSSTRKASK
jgi:predicted HTH transcriptional regulator